MHAMPMQKDAVGLATYYRSYLMKLEDVVDGIVRRRHWRCSRLASMSTGSILPGAAAILACNAAGGNCSCLMPSLLPLGWREGWRGGGGSGGRLGGNTSRGTAARLVGEIFRGVCVRSLHTTAGL